MKNGIAAIRSRPGGTSDAAVTGTRIRRPSGRRHVRLDRIRPFGAEHLEDVERPDDPVLEPVDDQDGPDTPAEPQDARKRDEVREDQGGDGTDRRADAVPGDEPSHVRDATRTWPARAGRLRGELDRADGDGPALGSALDAQLDSPADDVADQVPLEVADALDRLAVELGDDVADTQPGIRRRPGLEQLDDLEAARPADPCRDDFAERPGPADDAEERSSDPSVDDERVEDRSSDGVDRDGQPEADPGDRGVDPDQRPRESASAPPELPGLSAASVWMTFSISRFDRPSRVGSERPSALTTPAVTVPAKPSGLPIATTS